MCHSYLPHGPGFRFVDRVISLDPGVRGTGEYRLRGDEPFLAGHFPDRPLMPGVLMVEALAQLAGIVAQSDPDNPTIPDLRLSAIRQAKLNGTVKPGETLSLAAEILKRLGNLVQASGVASVGGRIVLRAEICLGGVPEEGE